MAKYTYWNKWTTPIFESEDPNYENIRDGAIRESLEYYNSEDRVEVAPGLKGRLYESEFDFFKKAREFGYQSLISIEDFIHDQFKICFLDYFQNGYWSDDTSPEKLVDVTEYTLDVDIKESWVHVANGEGSWHGTHNHPMTSWGAIYYIQMDDTKEENGGQNSFSQPFDNMYTDFGNFFQHDYSLFTLQPQNGKVVYFPANLWHNAKPFYGTGNRIVVAANICVHKKIIPPGGTGIIR